MDTNKKNENLIYLFIWLIVIALPVLPTRGSGDINWSKAFADWLWTFPFFLIFILNNSLLLPRLFFRKKNYHYFVVVLLTIVTIAVLSVYTKDIREYFMPPDQPYPGGPDPFLMRPMPSGQFPPARPFGKVSLTGRLINNMILSFLIVGFNLAVKLIFKRQQEDQLNEEQKKLYIQTELSFLKQQISPHFFLNTLNNIHALVDISAEQAKESIIRLSELMSYMLYESQTEKISVQRELNFIRSYVELMKMRFTEEVDIRLNIPVDLPNASIPPLLTISFIENAFKHGISYERPSFVYISYRFQENQLIFEIENAVHRAPAKKANSGIGITNARNRLNLLYNDKYELIIT